MKIFEELLDYAEREEYTDKADIANAREMITKIRTQLKFWRSLRSLNKNDYKSGLLDGKKIVANVLVEILKEHDSGNL